MEKKQEQFKFFLSMQGLVDEFEEYFLNIQFYKGNSIKKGSLRGVRLFYNQDFLDYHYIYIARAKDLQKTMDRVALIILGEVPAYYKESNFSIIQLDEEENIMKVLDICQDIFKRNEEWSDSLCNILLNNGSIDELCRVSYEYFKNPLFVHDTQLNVVSCPVWREGMVEWSKDETTGLVPAPMDTINEFNTDKEYIETLNTKGAQFFSASLRGYRDIYVNIWDDYDNYEGRLVICELESPLRPGQMMAAEYLALAVKRALKYRNRLDPTYNQSLEALLEGMLRGDHYPEDEIAKRIGSFGWKIEDKYVCIRMDIEEKDRSIMSVLSLCEEIEARVSGSKALCNEERICIVINLTLNGHHTSDVAYILREGLFKAGVSNYFRDFTKLDVYYHQASVALRYCRKKNDTRWSATFDEAALDYFIESASPNMDILYMCSKQLLDLRDFDEKNGTEYYDTVQAYIENERNTVKTAKTLYIGRSTLFYRLKKIKEIVGLDTEKMADARLNLYLRLSLYIIEKNKMLDS